MVNYENLDNHQTGIHDYFKFLKFGFARATDQLSYQIRRGKIKRSDAIKIVKEIEGKYPKSYMGKSIKDILKKINMDEKKFIEICDQFTNKNIFKTNQANQLVKDNRDLIKLNYGE